MKKIPVVLLDRIVSLIVVIIFAFLLFFLARLYFQYHVKSDLASHTEAGIHKFEQLTVDVVTTLRTLNQKQVAECDETLLVHMRREMFKSQYIHDIGFLQGEHLICTTGLGVLERPYLDEEPDYIGISGFRVFVNRRLVLFDQVIFATIVRLDSYNAVIKLESLASLINGTLDWELVYTGEQKSHYVSGTHGIYRAANQANNDDLLYHISCSEKVPYCLAIHSDPEVATASFQTSYRLMFVIAFILSIVVYVGMKKRIKRYRSLPERVKRGFKADAFYCLYQPIVELQTGKIIGCEVLARYEDNQGQVFPDQFIPLIAKLNLSWPFTEQILNQAIADFSEVSQVLAGFRMNINIFAKDISQSRVTRLCQFKGLEQVDLQLIVEITEDEELASQTSANTLEKLSQHGFEIAVDDFGTGYSNLKQLRDFHCDALKIDRSFISEMEDGSIRSTLIPHIVEIANKLDLKIVAEGVENEAQRQALIDEGVQYAQGWLFGKPMPMKDLAALVAAQPD